MKKYILLVAIILTFLSSCNKNSPKKEVTSKFVRVWFDTVQGMPFSSKLEIKANKTFEYSSHSCESGSESYGTWKMIKDTIVLKSIKPKTCRYQHRFVFCYFNKETASFDNNTTIKGCVPNGGEVDYEVFEDEKFVIRNDTLIHKSDKKSPCPNLVIAFSKKEKIRIMHSKN